MIKESPDEGYHATSLEPIVALKCRLSGSGLTAAALFRETSFTIDSTKYEGGQAASFFVMLRSSTGGTRIRSRIIDNEDGSYTVFFKPLVSGRITIRITLNGEDLPGSPCTCVVHDTAPCAPKCSVEGVAPNGIVSRRPENFFVSFRDANGDVTHAVDLDVFVEHKVEHGDTSADSSHPDALLKPFGLSTGHQNELVKLFASSKPLVIRTAMAMDSERLGHVSPGACMTVLKVESFDTGTLCACIVLNHDTTSSDSWREIYTQDPSWRTQSWRKAERESIAAQIREIARAQLEVDEARERERQRLAEEAAAKARALAEEEARRIAAEEEERAREEARLQARLEARLRAREAKKEGQAEDDGKKKGDKQSPKKKPKPKLKPKSKASDAASATGTSDTDGHDASATDESRTTANPPEPDGDVSYKPDSTQGSRPGNSCSPSTSEKRQDLKPLHAQQLYGWVTIVKDGQMLVSKPFEKLPTNLKQLYESQWKRRLAMNTERERDKLMMREEELDRHRDQRAWDAKSCLAGVVSNKQSLPANLYLQELEADPIKIGFAYGGMEPGRLRAKGQLVEQHKVHYSIGLCGTYLLHVMLRHSEQAAPLPGSPFTVRVLPGAAHGPSTRLDPREIPLRGVFELVTDEGTLTSTARCYCKMVLHSCDKMGNPCSNGGSVVTCGVTNSSMNAASKTIMEAQTTEARSLVVESKTTDQGDGTYLLEWWSVSSGAYEIYIKIDGLHVLGSPTYMLLTSGTPDISKTEVISFPQRADAGKSCKTRLKCKDQYKNPALPGRDLRFGLATVPSLEKDPLAWKQAKVTVLAHTIIGEELELRFTCSQAGDFRAYLFAIEVATARAKKSMPSGDGLAADGDAVDYPAGNAATPVSPNAKSPPKPLKPQVLGDTNASRTVLPGSPFSLSVTSATYSVSHSFLNGIMQNVHGHWERVSDQVLRAALNEGEAKADEEILQIGDTIRFRPEVNDAFGNSTTAPEDQFTVTMKSQSYGLEQLRVAPQATPNGGWVHDFRYELKRKGLHVLHVMLDGVDVKGSPVEFNVKFRQL